MSPKVEKEEEAAAAVAEADDVCLSCRRICSIKQMEFTFDEIFF